MSDGFALFATDIGACAVAWNALGLTGVWLPEVSAGRLRSKIARRWPRTPEETPPLPVAQAIVRITRLIGGERADLLEVRLDASRLSAFDRGVYAEARRIAPGRVVTYAMLADRVAAAPRRARSVKRSAAIPFRSSCLAIASSPPTANLAAFRHRAASRRSGVC